MFKNIMAPVDGSAASNRGLKRAIQLAKESNATLVIVHVVDEGPLYRSISMEHGAYYNIDEVIADLMNFGRKILQGALKSALRQGVKAQCILLEDITQPVADAVVKQAKKSHADVIVIGTHGRRGLSRLVMGSDAENIVRKSPVPVILVRALATSAKTRPSPKRTARAEARAA